MQTKSHKDNSIYVIRAVMIITLHWWNDLRKGPPSSLIIFSGVFELLAPTTMVCCPFWQHSSRIDKRRKWSFRLRGYAQGKNAGHSRNLRKKPNTDRLADISTQFLNCLQFFEIARVSITNLMHQPQSCVRVKFVVQDGKMITNSESELHESQTRILRRLVNLQPVGTVN